MLFSVFSVGLLLSVAGREDTGVEARFSKDGERVQTEILRSVDKITGLSSNGGGYFMGIKADPPESPLGLNLGFFGCSLVSPTRASSYCSGATYGVLMMALEALVKPSPGFLTREQFDALRMQEPNGKRREDEVGFWGWWNADGPGSFYALTEYTNLGRRVSLREMRAGDFVNINWVKGGGHSVVFLGWEKTAAGKSGMRFWSSQSSTNGFGEVVVSFDSVDSIVATRLTTPENLFLLNPFKVMTRKKVSYDKISDQEPAFDFLSSKS